ncbi:MAG: hypothetical protein WA793_07315, partial [Sphingorhabdus sp.]|uniref:hypothetical protein n=1 Tax=Sphingorhabdus sp. TaxID=1902408 RepID=UPI003CA505DC
EVTNVGAPVSTSAFEYEAEISQDGQTMIIVADRGDKSHLYHFKKTDGAWVERGLIAAKREVFQVGPLLSADATRLLFAQADGNLSGEMFVTDLTAKADRSWPPQCTDKRQLYSDSAR